MIKYLLLFLLIGLLTKPSFGQFKQVRTMNQNGEIVMLDFPVDFRMNTGPKIGGKLPSFEFVDINGDTIASSDYDNKLLVMNFWATWCKGCKQEEPNLTLLTQEIKSDSIEFVSVCMSSIGRTKSYVKKHGNFGYKTISLESKETFAESFGKFPFPTHMIIKNGVVKEYFNFALTTEEEIEWYKKRILDELHNGM